VYADGNLKSADGRCLGMMSHWLWPQPMVSLLGCGGGATNLTLRDGMLTSSEGGCFGVSNLIGPPSSIWRKPLSGGRVAALAINGAAVPHTITVDLAAVLAPDATAGLQAADEVEVTDVWSGESTRLSSKAGYTRSVRPHGNIFVIVRAAQ